MITVTLNRTEFEYDIHSLIKAFFPKEDVELYYTKEAHADEKNVACTNHSAEQEEAGSSHFSIDYADDRISIAWDDAPDGPARRTFAVDFSNRTETKNALKEHLYRLLEEETGQPLPWGTLTGIRPTKIPMQMLDEGKTKEEIASYMKQTYLASDEKINLSIAIAEREREYLQEQMQMVQEAASASDEIYRMLEQFDLPNSAMNVNAIQSMMANRNQLFRQIFGEESTNPDREKKITAEDIEAIKESIIEDFGEAVSEPEALAEVQETLGTVAENVMKTMISSDEVTSIDVREMRLMQAKLSINQTLAKKEQYSIPVLD
jgi:hypothetical protein